MTAAAFSKFILVENINSNVKNTAAADVAHQIEFGSHKIKRPATIAATTPATEPPMRA